jgi:cadherin 5 type 2 (VE-cadherin)
MHTIKVYLLSFILPVCHLWQIAHSESFSYSLFSFSVPDKVQGVSVSNSARSDYLKVSWVHATGDFDHYEVTIKNKNNFIQTKSIPKSENECVFVQLVPGRLYSVTVSTKSGQYEASEQGNGRTSKWNDCKTWWF